MKKLLPVTDPLLQYDFLRNSSVEARVLALFPIIFGATVIISAITFFLIEKPILRKGEAFIAKLEEKRRGRYELRGSFTDQWI